ncbi:tripartite tricarboxylate transporter substrate binding protein [Ramlibacter sp. PS3R-8]|uniref:Bug family tripartite tricarboxylate transporter substrate binding protein n=1 Tax=Ramlibacter sp. PS3R-8 TaxID=3133437 RepID=UPI0030B0F4DF
MNRGIARRRGAAVVGFIGAALWCWCAAAGAQAYPSKPIRVIVPFAAGGTADLAARVVAEPMGQALAQPLVIDNKPGAGGTLGTAVAAKEPADGYTIGLGSVSTHATSVSLYKDLRYDPRRDFTPIGMIAEVPNVLVVSSKLGVNSVAELVAKAKAEPGALNFGSIGNGTSQHLGGELFKLVTGTRLTHVPYKQNAQLTGDLLVGQIHMIIDNLPNVQQHIASGALKALAVTTEVRSPALPNVPTMVELGYPDFSISSWVALYAPAGTPPDHVARLSRELQATLQLPRVRERLTGAGMNVRPLGADQLRAFMDTEIARWARVVQASGARID